MDYVFAGLIIAVPLLIVAVILLWLKVIGLNKKAVLSIYKTSNANWIIYIWFTLGIAVLIFSVFEFDNGIKLRETSNPTDSVLSILVTFLVAWQIWQTIDSKRIIDKIKEENEQSKLQTKMQVYDSTSFCLAMLALHEGYEAVNRDSDSATAYVKFATALLNFLYVRNIASTTKSSEACLADLRKHLEAIKGEKRVSEKEKFNRYNKDLDILYDSIIKLSNAVKLPKEYIKRIKELNKERKELLKQWGYTTPS